MVALARDASTSTSYKPSLLKAIVRIARADPAVAFVRDNAAALEAIANLWWARYLEKVNLLAPLVIEKVERGGAQRGSLGKYLAILRAVDGERCFYCERPFSEQRTVHVDHVIPWSFPLSDPVWDLVLACRPCNLSKSDVLPHHDFIDKSRRRTPRERSSRCLRESRAQFSNPSKSSVRMRPRSASNGLRAGCP